MTKNIPKNVQAMLDDFIHQITEQAPDLLHGIYLYGSLALGAYNPQKSDIDFIALLTRPCTTDDLDILENIHEEISQTYPKAPLDGSYLQVKDLGKFNSDLAPYPYFDGTFHDAGHYDVNLVTWWTLKHHGICIYGEALNTDHIAIDWQTLLNDMHDNLNSYWHDWATNPEKHQLLIHDGAIEWTVLGILRQYYSFREDAITSKTGAGEYALLHLPDKWHRLIEDALLIRNHRKSLYHDKAKRQKMTVNFLNFIITECNFIFNDKLQIL